jgi:hypothetical protein
MNCVAETIWHAPFKAARNTEIKKNALSTIGVVDFHGYAEQNIE